MHLQVDIGEYKARTLFDIVLVFVLCMSLEILKENKKFSKTISFAQT